MHARDQGQEPRRAVVSVSVPPAKREAFYTALATLKRHHSDPFIQAAPLIVETIIEAASRVEQEVEAVERKEERA